MIELSLDGRELRSSIVAERARFARLYLLRWRDLAADIHVNESRTMIELPPLPQGSPEGPGLTLEEMMMFTAEQMRSYAQAAVLAERERCAKLAEALYCERGCEVGEEVAAAIRSQK